MSSEIYTWKACPFCIRAKALLDEKGVKYTEHVMDGKTAELEEIKRKYQHTTVPIVILDDEFVGGFSELQMVADAGVLDN